MMYLIKNEILTILRINAFKRGIALAVVFSILALANFSFRFNDHKYSAIFITVTNLLSLAYTSYSTNLLSFNPGLNLLLSWTPMSVAQLLKAKNVSYFILWITHHLVIWIIISILAPQLDITTIILNNSIVIFLTMSLGNYSSVTWVYKVRETDKYINPSLSHWIQVGFVMGWSVLSWVADTLLTSSIGYKMFLVSVLVLSSLCYSKVMIFSSRMYSDRSNNILSIILLTE